MNRLLVNYNENVKPELMKTFGYSSVMQVPKIEKIVINMGVGDAITNSKVLDAAVEDLKTITGQKPIITKAKKSIAAFKLREGVKWVDNNMNEYATVTADDFATSLQHLLDEKGGAENLAYYLVGAKDYADGIDPNFEKTS